MSKLEKTSLHSLPDNGAGIIRFVDVNAVQVRAGLLGISADEQRTFYILTFIRRLDDGTVKEWNFALDPDTTKGVADAMYQALLEADGRIERIRDKAREDAIDFFSDPAQS